MFRLDNKIAVIFGGSGYLGQQLCKVLVEQGATVYNYDIKAGKSEIVDVLENKYSKQYNFIKLDASNPKQVKKEAKKLFEKEKRIDILVTSTTMKGNDFYLPFEDVSLEGWNIGLMGNLTLPFIIIQAFIPYMREQKKGSVINISSHYGLVGNDQSIYEGSNLHEIYVKDSPDITQIFSHGVYNAAKGGLNNFTRYLAAYYGKYNVRVNTVSPGGIWMEGENETFLKKYGAKVPLGRKANPDEINGAIVYLASDASTYVTGHNLVVDGGYSIW
jgi:NAD(P)-dependent dehydrogenase (short-subunit alcohol dehydrogenase family)